jgi:hypothetical protein
MNWQNRVIPSAYPASRPLPKKTAGGEPDNPQTRWSARTVAGDVWLWDAPENTMLAVYADHTMTLAAGAARRSETPASTEWPRGVTAASGDVAAAAADDIVRNVALDRLNRIADVIERRVMRINRGGF